MRKPHTAAAAEISRDSFAKALYDRLFTWIVGHVNSAIDPALIESDMHHNSTLIGVLDIYGFEVIESLITLITINQVMYKTLGVWQQQLRAVLHQLLQRKATATLHRAGAQTATGGIRAGGHWVGKRIVHRKWDCRHCQLTNFRFQVHIEYFNNEIICQLIDLPHKGIMALMDEACLNVGKTTDPMLLEAMDRKLKVKACFR